MTLRYISAGSAVLFALLVAGAYPTLVGVVIALVCVAWAFLMVLGPRP